MSDKNYPLKFDPVCLPKAWGGRGLDRYGRKLPDGAAVGESWELADVRATCPTGAGGQAVCSEVSNGPWVGRTLRALIAEQGQNFLGRTRLNGHGEFPLLIKYLDVRENLSVQVHPDEKYCNAYPGAHVKNEAWVVLHAEPDAVVYKGFNRAIGSGTLLSAIACGQVDLLLHAVPTRTGDTHYIPAGTCHALGKGLLIAEVQTTSDTTFRIFDWHRTGRDLHIEQALRCTRLEPTDTACHEQRDTPHHNGSLVRTAVSCDDFRIKSISTSQKVQLPIPPYDRSVIYMFLEGSGVICSPGRSFLDVPFSPLDTFLLPAGLGPILIESHGAIKALEVTPQP